MELSHQERAMPTIPYEDLNYIFSDAVAYGTGVYRITNTKVEAIPVAAFFQRPLPGERSIDMVWFSPEYYDDGGGPALAAYRFGLCV